MSFLSKLFSTRYRIVEKKNEYGESRFFVEELFPIPFWTRLNYHTNYSIEEAQEEIELEIHDRKRETLKTVNKWKYHGH